MLKIFLFESGTTGWGGSFKSCFYITTALKKQGYSVIVGYLNKSEYWNKIAELDILTRKFYHRFYSNEIKNLILNRLLRKIDKQAKKWFSFVPFSFDNLIHHNFIVEVEKTVISQKIDLIHTNTNFIRDIEIFKLAKKLNLPVVCHLRMDPYRQLTFAEKKIAKYQKAEFVAISESIMKKWIEAGVPKQKIRLIYNAQPPLIDLYDRENKEELKLETSPISLLFVGRLSRIKGVDILINALTGIDKKLWKLSIVGDGSEKEFLKELVKDNNLSQNVTFYGYQEEIKEFYINNDILIVPSLKEPFGRVIIEAMQLSLPVIASNIDGPAEIIENGKDGILFNPGDSKDLARAIKFLINNPQERYQMGLAGREKQKLFSGEIFIEKLEKIYNSLCIK